MKQSVDHVATFCGFLVAVNYKLRHDEVLKIIVFGMMRKLGLLDSFVKLRDFKPPKARTWVRKGGDVVFTTDAEVQTTNKVQYNKPDIFVKDSRSKKIIIGDSLLNTALWREIDQVRLSHSESKKHIPGLLGVVLRDSDDLGRCNVEEDVQRLDRSPAPQQETDCIHAVGLPEENSKHG